MRTKTIAWSGFSALSTSTSISALCFVSTGSWNCATVSIVSVAASTWMICGSYM